MSDEWGIEHGYHDVRGEWRSATPATVAALRAAMGAPDGPPHWAPDAVRCVRHGHGEHVGHGDLVLEDGTRLRVEGDLPHDVPLGYHRFEHDHGHLPLIVAPDRCHLPAGGRAWGFAVQLYAARSRRSWGVGDLGDLATVARWAHGLGARAMLVNPLHAVAPTAPLQASPYSPASRRFRNPLYLRVEDVPGAALAAAEVASAAAAGRELSARPTIDRDAVWELKLRALEAVWAATGGGQAPAFEAWLAEHPAAGPWGVWCVLTERHGADWRSWPAEVREPAAAARALDAADADRARFHRWLQWCTEEQLTAATEGLTVVQDLPIGVDRGGFDAWTWQDQLALDVTVGAPPDVFSPGGQDWGLPPFVPCALRAAAYQPFVETVRATIAGAGGLRIDHVMGLFRLFWIPPGGSPGEGTYVRYPSGDLLDIVCLESVRAGALVVGEDLGTVEPGVRETMAERNVLGYKLLWFEPGLPSTWPVTSMAAVTTHDLPTVAGMWTGADLAEQIALDRPRDEDAEREVRSRVAAEAGLADDAPPEEAVLAAHRLLATAPCALLSATLEDAVGEVRRPNLPGTVTERPNWSIPLPVRVEDLDGHPLATALARTLDDAVRGVDPDPAG